MIADQGIELPFAKGDRWRGALAAEDAAWPDLVRGVFKSPLLVKTAVGWGARPVALGNPSP